MHKNAHSKFGSIGLADCRPTLQKERRDAATRPMPVDGQPSSGRHSAAASRARSTCSIPDDRSRRALPWPSRLEPLLDGERASRLCRRIAVFVWAVKMRKRRRGHWGVAPAPRRQADLHRAASGPRSGLNKHGLALLNLHRLMLQKRGTA